MREIVLDTETTGLEPELGHRVVEIACIELNNHLPTGVARRWYLNPDRDMPTEAYEVHGISAEFLRAQPRFAEVADEFLLQAADEPGERGLGPVPLQRAHERNHMSHVADRRGAQEAQRSGRGRRQAWIHAGLARLLGRPDLGDEQDNLAEA